MRRIAAIGVALVILASLTGCDDARDSKHDRFMACIQAGGSWHSDTWSNTEECNIPSEGGKHE